MAKSMLSETNIYWVCAPRGYVGVKGLRSRV